MTRRVVIVGGGFGGLRVAKLLAQRYRTEDVEVVLVDRSPFHTLRPKLPQAVGGRIACAVHLPFQELLRGTGIRFVQAAVTEVDPVTRRIAWDGGQLTPDALVIALGGESRVPAHLLERADGALPVWSFDQACGLRRRVQFLAQAAGQGKPVNLDVAVIGGGFVGVELTAEIQHRLTRQGGARKPGRVVLVEREARLLPRLDPWAGRVAARRLADLGVEVVVGTGVEKIRPGVVALKDGRALQVGTVVWAGGVQAPDLLARVGLADSTGRIPVSATLQSPHFPGVYALGDCAYIVENGVEACEPSAHRAEREAGTVAHNVAAQLDGKRQNPHRPDRAKYLLGLGPGYGILTAPPLPQLTGWFPALVKEAVTGRHIWQIGGLTVLRMTLKQGVFDALRSGAGDGDPLPEGNLLHGRSLT